MPEKKKIADMNCPKCGKKFKRYPMTLKQWENPLRVHLLFDTAHMGKFTQEEVKSIIEKHLKSFGQHY